MASDNPTLEGLRISGRPAGALKAAGLETRSALEAFGLDRIEEVKGIGSDYADEIRAKVASSYKEEPSLVEVQGESPEVGEPALKAPETETVKERVEAAQESSQVGEPTPKAPEAETVDKERLERATLMLAAGILGHPAVGPLLTPPFHREADLARTARMLAEAVIKEIDRDDRDQGAE